MRLIILKSSFRSYIYRYMILLFLLFDSINSLTFSVFTFYFLNSQSQHKELSYFWVPLLRLLSSALHTQNCRLFLLMLLLSPIFLPSVLVAFRQLTFFPSLHFVRFLAAVFGLWEKSVVTAFSYWVRCMFLVLTTLPSVASSSNSDVKIHARVFSG